MKNETYPSFEVKDIFNREQNHAIESKEKIA